MVIVALPGTLPVFAVGALALWRPSRRGHDLTVLR
jgi:hypothetical protein